MTSGNLFTTTEFRWQRMVWLVGIILGTIGIWIAAFAFNNTTETVVFFGLSIICYIPLLCTTAVSIHKIRKEIKCLQLQMDIVDRIIKTLDEPVKK